MSKHETDKPENQCRSNHLFNMAKISLYSQSGSSSDDYDLEEDE